MNNEQIKVMLRTLSDSSAKDRSNYHLTLGELIKALENCNQKLPLRFDMGLSPSHPHSFRGYYSDLSFEPVDEEILVCEFLGLAQEALGKTYEGYKGGDNLMTENTPLWAAEYGSCGLAIVDIDIHPEEILLCTKNVDD